MSLLSNMTIPIQLSHTLLDPDVEDSESTGDGGKFFHVLILMCDYRNVLV